MAENGVRKSNRIKSRARMIYTEDDFDYEMHLDVSYDISNILESNSQQKNKNGPGARKKANSSKKADKISTPRQQGVELSAENDQRVFGDVLVTALDVDTITKNFRDNHITCSVCNEKFVSSKELKDHMSEHHNEDGKLNGFLVCDKCHQLCTDQSSYNRHMKLHSDGRKFKCEICEKAFADSCSLKRHVKSHDGDRSFTCDICFKSFRDSPSLMRHQVTHTDRPRMFQCSNCRKSFADRHSLRRHERTHTGLRPFECKTCLKTFSETGSFKRHLKIHTGIRNFSCPVCRRGFLEKQSLIRHQRKVCGFGDVALSGNTSSYTSVSVDQSLDSCDTGTDNTECASVGGGISTSLNENSLTSDSLNTLTSTSSSLQSKSLIPVTPSSNNVSAKNVEAVTNPKDAPSLHSLMLKDPNLYNSISEIVDSIDSYEKMLDLCGEMGQVAIDAALTRVHVPMPDNLLCFECGELLVDGDNFKRGGKRFHPSLCNSYKCLNCEDDDYGEPPVLTAETPDESVSTLNAMKNDITDKQLQEVQQNKPKLLREYLSKNIFGTNESLDHLRERLKTQHGVFFLGDAYCGTDDGQDEESDTNDQVDETSSYSTTSRSHSTDRDFQISAERQDTANNLDSNENVIVATDDRKTIQPELLSKKSPIRFSTPKEQQGLWTNITPKMDYEVDDQNIPSVFPCHLCTKVFASSAFLARHLDLHKNSPHKCMVCSKTFTNSQSLKRHMNTHTGEKPYTCPYCKKRFRDPSNFSKHKKLCSTISTPSPAASIFSRNSVSSPQSLDDSSLVDHIGSHMTDLKQQLSFPSHTSTARKMSHNTRFSYDDDESEDLPVAFGHPVADSEISSSLGQFTETDVKSINPDIEDNEGSDCKAEPEEDGTPVPCLKCGKMFENEKMLDMHMKYHSGDPKLTCIECGKSFADNFGLKRHLRIHAGIRPHVCEYCDRGYCDNWSLKKHKSRGCMLLEIKVPADFLHPCSQCTKVFSEMDYLEEHMKTHKGLLKFECDICQKKFSEAFNLKRHRRLHMAVCPGCDREFRDIQSLVFHRANDCSVDISDSGVANKEDGFPCPECGRIYSTKAYLERHKKFHSDLRPYVCEICNKRFSEAFRLRRHLKVHNDYKPFSCEICGKRFSDMTSQKRHTSSSSCSLTKEQQLQQEIVDFPCQFCEKVFTRSYLLTRHMNVHSQERPFACDECRRAYKDISSLRRHQMIHQGIKNFVCTVCDKGFFYSDSLKRHMAGSCGKKPKPCRRGKRRRKIHDRRKSNMKMTNNNNIGKVVMAKDPTTETPAFVPLSTSFKNKMISARDVRTSHWSCHKMKQCWRCSRKFETTAALHKHSRIHYHKKPYHCLHCFFRWSRKLYLMVHLMTHKCKSQPRKEPAHTELPTQLKELRKTTKIFPKS